MDFFNKIGKKASETYKVTAEKTSKLAKEAKLRMKMNENKSDIEDLYKQIGKKVYETHLTEDSINIKDVLEEEVTKIEVLSDEIENILKEIMCLKDVKKCPNCYEKIDKCAKFCPNCGAEQEHVVKPETEEATDEEPEKEVEKEDDDVINPEEIEEVEEAEELADRPVKEVEIADMQEPINRSRQ